MSSKNIYREMDSELMMKFEEHFVAMHKKLSAISSFEWKTYFWSTSRAKKMREFLKQSRKVT